ncbi:MAG TPA: hypothetical protein ENN55_00615, partial [Firmicutes bacterium]|nr:hypothetical protein [Bacillota bacterium]
MILKGGNLKKIFFAVILTAFFSPVFADEKPAIITDFPTTLTYPSFWHTPFGINRGTPFWLKVFLGNRTYFSDPQGIAATKLLVEYGRINKGRDDWQLTVYGVNSGRSEVIYNSSMKSLAIFGREGNGDGELYLPKGIACNEFGDIYVADTGNHRVARFYNDGSSVRFITNIGQGFGEGKGQFKSPSYTAVDSAGRLYVSDTGNNRIQVFSKSGGLIRTISTGLHSPLGIAVCDDLERFTGYRQNFIFVIDGYGARIQKLDFEGNIVNSVRLPDLVSKHVMLTTLALDYYGNVYTVDNYNSQVHKFSPELNFITSFGSFGTEAYQFEKPTGITIYKHYGQVFVSDRESAQYFWLGSDITDFKYGMIKGAENYTLEMDFFLTEKAYLTAVIE